MTTTRALSFALLAALAIVLIAAAPQTTSKPADAAAEAARLNNIGVAYMNQQLFEKGLKQFEQASATDPKFLTARTNRGIALFNLQRIDESKALLLETVQVEPNNPNAWYNLGLLYKNSGDPQASTDAFRKVTEIDHNDPDAWYLLGTVYVQQKQFPPAMDAFEHALKLDPLHASAEFGMSRAYQQSGDPAHAREHLKRFQYITQNKLGATMSLTYGDQGKYSRALESPAAPPKVPPVIKVKFVDVTKEAGLTSKPSVRPTTDGASFAGPGACFLDYDNDGNVDLFLPDNGTQGSMSLYHNLGNGKFEDVTKKAGLDRYGPAISCTAGDYDNDGFTDLVVGFGNRILLLHNEKNGTFKDVTQEAGIDMETDSTPSNAPARRPEITGLTFVDYDHDGDLDLYVTQLTPEPAETSSDKELPGHNRMWRNNGNGTFSDVTEATGLNSLDSTDGAIGTDFNNDRAVDIVTTRSGNLARATLYSPVMFENPREGKFHRLFLPEFDPSVAVAALDFDHDGWMDYAFTHFGFGISLWRNNHGRTFDQVQLPKYEWHRCWGVAAFDYDNDGWVDLAAVGETKDGKGEIRLFRNLGPDGFKDVTAEVGLDKIQLKNPRALITGDFDGDGTTDLLITQNHGPVVLLRNEGATQNHWLRLSLKGLNDNKTAIGTKVEVFSGGNRQKFEIAGSSGYLGQNSTDIVVGLGQSKEADVVRMLWPTGVLQDEIQIAGNREQGFTEMDRRGSSCPTLFAWDGRHYELVADVIGAAVVGHWVAPGERNIPRATEYVKVDRHTLRLKDGKLSFRLMEPMEEVVYLDRVSLLAVDHPSQVEVYPNEYFASNPPYPPFKVVTSQNAKLPAGAWDGHGHNVLPDLLANRYFGDFEVLPFKGFTKPHSLELDLGEPYRGGPLRLLLHGEIEYFTATGMYAAGQAGIQATAPSVDALGADGEWRRVVDDMGFPAGLPRTMTAELTGKIPVGTQRIRISTNLQIYWDNILIDRSDQNTQVRLTPVPLDRADLDFHGYPRQIEGQPPGNVKYVYEQVSRTGPYARQAGAYTRYGDVRPLLADSDDRFVVFGSGEEVALEFDPSKLPPLPSGWTRDYFFVANGYEKDMDFYAFNGNLVEPLPFRAMGTYPYPGKQYPLDDEHLNYLLEYNTRYLSGNEPRGYWYDYESSK